MGARASGITALAAVLMAAAACSPDDAAPSSGPTPSPAATEASAPEAEFIFYLLGKQLLRFGIETSFSRIIEDLPSHQAAVSPDGRRAVFVQESHLKGMKGTEFREPIIRIATAKPGLYNRAVTLGAGEKPVWSPLDGRSIAAIDLDGTPVLYDTTGTPGQEGEPLDGNETWALFGWDPKAAMGELFETVDFGTGEFLDAAMAPGGGSVAAVTPQGVILVDVPTGGVTEVEKSADARQVMWGPDGETFVFTRVKGNRWHVFLCRANDHCKDLFYWPRPLKLVGVTS